MQKIAAVVICILVFATAAHADITIGVSAPLTGPAASISEISLPGVKQAVADINARGGIKGEKLKLEIMDDACDPKQAVQAANKLLGMNVVAVISVSCSNAASAAAPVFEEDGMPQLITLASAPEITRQGYRTLLRPGSRDDQDATAAVDFIARAFPDRKIAIIDDKSTWGKSIAGLVSTNLKAKGFGMVDTFSLNAGEQDFSALIGRLKAKNYDVVYEALFMREAGLITRQMKEQQYKPAVIGSITLAMQDFINIAGPAKNGVFFTRVPLTDKALVLAEKLKARPMESVYNVQAYSAVEVLAQAMEKAGTKPADLLGALHAGKFTTALGPITFTPNGDIADMTFEVWQHAAGGPKPVK